MAPLTISSAFDGGNIKVVSCSDPSSVQLEIRPEPYTDYDKRRHFQCVPRVWGRRAAGRLQP